MENVAAQGVIGLYEYGALVTILALIVLALAWFCKYLIERNARLSDKLLIVVEKNTQAFTELKEAIRNGNS